MKTGRKIIAVVTAEGGKPIVDLRDGNGYAAVMLEDGGVAIVESKSQPFYEIEEKGK